MSKMYHIYTTDEIKKSSHSPLNRNWEPTNYLTNVSVNDPNVGVRNVYFAAFNNKLDAFNYFRDFIADIQEDCHKKNYFFKLSQIDNSINLIKANENDKDIDLGIVDFDFEDLSLNTYSSGYWIDSVKLILKQIIDEIDVYFEIQSEDEIGDDYSDFNNSKFSASSLKKIQTECQNLINQEDTCNPIFIEKFNELCITMNDFWNYWWE